jgi:general stress protein 26
MNANQFLNEVLQIIEDSGRGLLATISTNGYPAMRWMNPVFLPGRLFWLYCATSKNFPKVADVGNNPKVSWLFTNQKTGELYSIRGKIRVIDNPRFSSEIIEELGRRLENFWRLQPDSSQLIVLETEIESGEYFNPKTGEKIQIDNISGEGKA